MFVLGSVGVQMECLNKPYIRTIAYQMVIFVQRYTLIGTEEISKLLFHLFHSVFL